MEVKQLCAQALAYDEPYRDTCGFPHSVGLSYEVLTKHTDRDVYVSQDLFFGEVVWVLSRREVQSDLRCRLNVRYNLLVKEFLICFSASNRLGLRHFR